MANPLADLNQVHSYMDELQSDLKVKIFNFSNTALPSRRKTFTYKSVSYISKRNDLDAFACMLMMIREAELIKHTDAYIHCKWEAHQLFCRIATFDPLKSMAPLIYDFIFKNFIERNNPLSSQLITAQFGYKPSYYRIPTKRPLPLYLNQNAIMLMYAISMNVINDTMEDQLNFLYWIDHGISKTKIIEALITLENNRTTNASTTNLPSPLDSLIQKLRGDSRKYITGNYYI